MLQDIREHTQGVVAKIIIGLIVAVFALWGVESIIGGFVTSPPVAEVNGEEITEAQLQVSAQNLLASIGGNLQSPDQGLLEQIALNRLIEETLLLQAAQNAAMSISSDHIDRSILQTESFQIGGVFDSDLALRTMASQGFSVPLYRDTLRRSMLMSQMANAYSGTNFVTQAELSKIAELTEQTRDFRYLSVTLGTRTLGTVIGDEEIADYYNANQMDFTEPETVVASYVMLDKELISQELELDEEEVSAQYEIEREAFEGSSEKRASHILFEAGGELSQDQALELAAGARQRLLDGEDFAALALELSDDTVSGEDGGDIGYSDGSAFPEEIEAALEVLTLDEVSEPVVTEFGVHLVKLTEDAENVFQSFEEARERIERELNSAEVELIYGERLEDLSNLAFETGNLQAISELLGLDILRSEAFSRAGGSGVFSNPNVIAAAYSDEVLLDGNNSDVIELNDSRSAVIRVEQFNEASLAPLEEVEAEIAVLLRTGMEREAVQALGDELAAAAESGADLEQLLADNELEWIDEQDMSRDSFTVNREILDQVFSMPPPVAGSEFRSMTLSNGTFVLVELNQVNAGTIDSIPEEQRETIRQSMLADLGNSDFQAFLSNLRANSDIQARNLEAQF